MNKTQLIDIVAKKTGMTKTETEFLLTVALETIVDAVAKGERVTLVGFGSFEARETKGKIWEEILKLEKNYTFLLLEFQLFQLETFFKNKVNSYFQNSDI